VVLVVLVISLSAQLLVSSILAALVVQAAVEVAVELDLTQPMVLAAHLALA
jgi:hypothetical protein